MPWHLVDASLMVPKIQLKEKKYESKHMSYNAFKMYTVMQLGFPWRLFFTGMKKNNIMIFYT